MSGANYVIDETIKKYIWEKNEEDIKEIFDVELPFLQNEIDALASAINTRFYKYNFDNQQVLTSDGLAPSTNNQINLIGDGFGMITINMSIQSQTNTTVQIIRQYDFGFRTDPTYQLLGEQNARVIFESGANVGNVDVSFGLSGDKLQVSVNPNGTLVSANINISISTI